MNKNIRLLISLIITLAIGLLLFYSYHQSYRSGIKHAVEQSCITVESNEVLIELDGQIYVHLAN